MKRNSDTDCYDRVEPILKAAILKMRKRIPDEQIPFVFVELAAMVGGVVLSAAGLDTLRVHLRREVDAVKVQVKSTPGPNI
jgi:hypothetical protein